MARKKSPRSAKKSPSPKKSATPKKGVKKAGTKAVSKFISKNQPAQVLAYDLGGTKVAVGVVDAKGKILAWHREPALFKLGKKATLEQLARLGREYIAKYPKIQAVGIASAGPLDVVTGNLLDPTNFAGPDGNWGIVPLTKILEKELKKPVILENDAAAALLAERWKGHAKGYANSMIMTLGTGLGTAFIANGELVRSGRHQHTEGGHIILKTNDRSAPCGCGNYGCAEAYLAGRTFAHRARVKLGNDQIDAPQVAARARRGEKASLALFEEYSEMMASALVTFAVLYAPEIVVLTGSFAAAHDLFAKNTLKYLEKMLARRNQTLDLTPRIEISSLENQAGLLGGAFVALRSLKLV